MDRREGNIKDRIIKATLEIARQEGIESVTIRKIAHIAGVNIASINYHFGCKDNILNEAINDFLNGMCCMFNIFDEVNIPPKEKLERFLNDYFDNIITNPFLSKSIMDQLISNSLQLDVCNDFKRCFQKLKNTMSEYTGIQDECILSMKTIQVLSNIMYPALIYEKAEYVAGINYKDKKIREKYILLLMDNIR